MVWCDTFGPPNTLVKPRPLPTPPARTEGSRCFAPKADMSKVTCHCCNCKGHYANSCTSKTGFMYCPLRKLLPREKTKWSRDRTLSLHYKSPTNVPTVPPERPLQAPEGSAAPSYGADHSPDKAELFVPDVGYSGDALHCVIVEDVHIVQTRSQAKAKGKAQAVDSKPYAHQLLDKAPDEGPGPSTDTSHLKGVNVAIPMDTMKAHQPKLCGSILKFLSMADDLDIHLVNKISSSYSECTYADIFVNKIKVRAIIDMGAPINIVFTRLVKFLVLAPDIDHRKQYGTAGLTVTTAQGAYSALPLCFGSLVVLASAIVLPNDNYDILIGTLFMRQYGVRTDLAADTFEILGQNIPLYYCRNKDTGTHKTMPSVNLAYKNGVIPI
ncbi:hypothetical protein DSO57_1033567 [Entomophthora muscae]|uniref:Uncharacterized protein n=1 Tax=Entomophthora muscae TaxID=34485 RepID=A0ACC2RQY7_9FUNG|nr:hypothetical protein DSO57_1033567 [Entomophthora muscae]